MKQGNKVMRSDTVIGNVQANGAIIDLNGNNVGFVPSNATPAAAAATSPEAKATSPSSISAVTAVHTVVSSSVNPTSPAAAGATVLALSPTAADGSASSEVAAEEAPKIVEALLLRTQRFVGNLADESKATITVAPPTGTEDDELFEVQYTPRGSSTNNSPSLGPMTATSANVPASPVDDDDELSLEPEYQPDEEGDAAGLGDTVRQLPPSLTTVVTPSFEGDDKDEGSAQHLEQLRSYLSEKLGEDLLVVTSIHYTHNQ
jgi:hypothetical protein